MKDSRSSYQIIREHRIRAVSFLCGLGTGIAACAVITIAVAYIFHLHP